MFVDAWPMRVIFEGGAAVEQITEALCCDMNAGWNGPAGIFVFFHSSFETGVMQYGKHTAKTDERLVGAHFFSWLISKTTYSKAVDLVHSVIDLPKFSGILCAGQGRLADMSVLRIRSEM